MKRCNFLLSEKKRPHPPAQSTDLKHSKAGIDLTNYENSGKAGPTTNNVIKEGPVYLTEDTPRDDPNTVCLTGYTRKYNNKKTDCLIEDFRVKKFSLIL